ncbi:hypothetical protein RHS01_04027 [Rhizoctonia solani]|uniref:Mannoprotein n=1 Tax=Rhizoctonia solani TaxID=456999 RepID=A0A8H7M6U6_9AGAM|nr:hypothetical protein RHS01_04027 [Rhizoctonia solani]
MSKVAFIVGASMAATVAFGQATTTSAAGSSAFTPLASKRFEYTALPYKADTGGGERGNQFGYNICNSTTRGPLRSARPRRSTRSMPNSLIGNTEGEAVAWCTKPGRGTRLIPAGALTGVQFMKTRSYVQVTGFIKQDQINIAANDDGGEMDPHGADRRGNPLGGLLFSNAFPSNGGNNNTFQQVVEWHNFMGANQFCLKACDPTDPDDDKYCEHIFDRIGCKYNAPAAYKDGVFESCQGENQDFPGIYTNAAGQVVTYTQPPESAGPINSIPYEPRIPASSNCVTFQSTALYAAASSASSASGSSSGTRTATTVPSSTSTDSSPNSAPSTFASFNVLAVGSVAVAGFIGVLAVL